MRFYSTRGGFTNGVSLAEALSKGGGWIYATRWWFRLSDLVRFMVLWTKEVKLAEDDEDVILPNWKSWWILCCSWCFVSLKHLWRSGWRTREWLRASGAMNDPAQWNQRRNLETQVWVKYSHSMSFKTCQIYLKYRELNKSIVAT